MQDLTRRSALTAALLTCGTSTVMGANNTEEESPSTDEEFVMAAGLTKDEARCWKEIAAAAGTFFKLPELHPMDKQEVAAAIHIVQNKLLARPTYRKYLELAKAARPEAETREEEE